MNKKDYFLDVQKSIGYKEGLSILKLNKALDSLLLLPKIQSLKPVDKSDFENLKKYNLDDVKKLAQQFYEKYFNLHNVSLYYNKKNITDLDPNLSKEEIKKKIDGCLVNEKVSPFDIPITLVDGHSMIGEIRKNIILCPGMDLSFYDKIPFTDILLGNQLTDISAPTLIHEIAHAETESIKGYTNNFQNKEIISIFLEKVSALELDPTGKLLELSEQERLKDLKNHLFILKLDKMKRINVSDQVLITSSMYINSILKANKLFDYYLKQSKQKKKDKVLYIIGDIFDGKMQVEDLLDKYNIGNSHDSLVFSLKNRFNL